MGSCNCCHFPPSPTFTPLTRACRPPSLQPIVAYTRKSDGEPGSRCVFAVTDASKRRVNVSVFMKGDERLQLSVGTAVGLRAMTEVWRHELMLKAFHDGVVCGGVPEADELAAKFRRAPWEATPLPPRWKLHRGSKSPPHSFFSFTAPLLPW